MSDKRHTITINPEGSFPDERIEVPMIDGNINAEKKDLLDQLHPLRKLAEICQDYPESIPSACANEIKLEVEYQESSPTPPSSESPVITAVTIHQLDCVQPDVHENNNAADDSNLESIEELQVCGEQAVENQRDDIKKSDEEEEAIFSEADKEKYVEIINNLLEIADNGNETSCCKCVGTCCFAVNCSCNAILCCGFCGSDDEDGDDKTVNITTESLDKGSAAGWKIFATLVTPLMQPFIRDLVATSEVVVGLISFILSALSFGLGKNTVYNALHLALATLSLALGLIDFVTSLRTFGACKLCCKKCSEQRQIRDACTIESGRINETHDNRHLCVKCLRKSWDVSRIIVAELILYPLTVCDIIGVITGRAWQIESVEDRISFFLFVLSSASLIFYVYIVRLCILGAMIYHLNKRRQYSEQRQQQIVYCTENAYNEQVYAKRNNKTFIDNAQVAKNGMRFQMFFFFHVMGQMAVQIFMLAAIAIKIEKDNQIVDDHPPLVISRQVWFMLVAGYVMPICGILSFFVATYYWVYQYPNGICLNVLSTLEIPRLDHIMFPNESTKKVKEKVERITEYLNKAQLMNDFKDLYDRSFFSKLSFPCKSPCIIFFCIAYGGCQFAFVLVSILTIGYELNGIIVYYVFSIIVGIVANCYTFAIAALWTIIIAVMIFLIALIIITFALCILCQYYITACLRPGLRDNKR